MWCEIERIRNRVTDWSNRANCKRRKCGDGMNKIDKKSSGTHKKFRLKFIERTSMTLFCCCCFFHIGWNQSAVNLLDAMKIFEVFYCPAQDHNIIYLLFWVETWKCEKHDDVSGFRYPSNFTIWFCFNPVNAWRAVICFKICTYIAYSDWQDWNLE